MRLLHLREDAEERGYPDLVALCDRALQGDADALREVEPCLLARLEIERAERLALEHACRSRD